MSDELHLWAASSGWDGPFQHHEVLVAADTLDEAAAAAEAAFDAVVQPVCRAKMRITDLGPVRPGAVGRPRRTGEAYSDRGVPIDRRCGVEPGA